MFEKVVYSIVFVVNIAIWIIAFKLNNIPFLAFSAFSIGFFGSHLRKLLRKKD